MHLGQSGIGGPTGSNLVPVALERNGLPAFTGLNGYGFLFRGPVELPPPVNKEPRKVLIRATRLELPPNTARTRGPQTDSVLGSIRETLTPWKFVCRIGGVIKVAVVGTSLLMALAVSRMRARAQIEIFERGDLGGAWGENPIGGLSLPKHNNIVVARSAEHESQVPEIFSELNSLGAKLRLVKTPVSVNNLEHIPRQYVAGRFFPVVGAQLKQPNVTVRPASAERVAVLDDRVEVNGELYDFLVMSPNSVFSSFSVEGKQFELVQQHNISRHVRALLRPKIVEQPLLEEVDEIFDRVSFINYGPESLFTGRVRKEKKHLSLQQALAASEYLSPYKRSLVVADSIDFPNTRTPEADYLRLKQQLEVSPVFYLPTMDLLAGYASLDNGLRALGGKLAS